MHAQYGATLSDGGFAPTQMGEERRAIQTCLGGPDTDLGGGSILMGTGPRRYAVLECRFHSRLAVLRSVFRYHNARYSDRHPVDDPVDGHDLGSEFIPDDLQRR